MTADEVLGADLSHHGRAFASFLAGVGPGAAVVHRHVGLSLRAGLGTSAGCCYVNWGSRLGSIYSLVLVVVAGVGVAE